MTVHKGAAAAWAATIAALGVVDWLADQRRNGSTVSAATRWAFRTHTPQGRRAFTAVLIAGGVVLHGHILKGKS